MLITIFIFLVSPFVVGEIIHEFRITHPNAQVYGTASGVGFLHLEIPSIGLSQEVVVGQGELDSRGLTHISYSSFPGKGSSNVVIVGHSIDYGRYVPPPFFYLKYVEEGDIVDLIHDDHRYRYRVSGKQVVKSSDVKVEEVVLGRSLITLYTCFPVVNPIYRLVIIAELVSIQ